MEMRLTTEARAWLLEQLGAARARCLRACDADDRRAAAAAVRTFAALAAELWLADGGGCAQAAREDSEYLAELLRI
ncbi:hypothetical protein GCM10022215_29630 [Nocardioides fonticola]|uniref:Uncharacterized protein n=1 Tax=Nocardioides fonticola TaxID=450363 RepID=A0ABP7XP88_9ACTN